jgi:hypothetical protein
MWRYVGLTIIIKARLLNILATYINHFPSQLLGTNQYWCHMKKHGRDQKKGWNPWSLGWEIVHWLYYFWQHLTLIMLNMTITYICYILFDDYLHLLVLCDEYLRLLCYMWRYKLYLLCFVRKTYIYYVKFVHILRLLC